MHAVRTQICLTAILSLLAATAHADVIGNAPKKPDAKPVAEKMQELGVAAEPAISKMTASDLEYFNAHPERVQMVGVQEVQNLWYESVFGGAFLVAMTALAIGIVVHNRDT